ncbi:MAG TPA: hypothetical protein VFA68_22175 [Terriglobales bacterium]|nr:hypothetical protein [Terriglobales bacterium]
MAKRFVSGIVGAIIGAGIVWFLLPPPPPSAGPLVVGIYATSDKTCDVQFPDVNLSWKRGDRIVWESLDNKYTIVFKPSGTCTNSGDPFGGIPIPVPANGKSQAQKPARKGDFCYEVQDGNGQTCDDPGLHVRD